MALTITHATVADVTFSAAGASNWDANHTLAGSVALNEISAATGSVTIASGNNTGIVWNWENTSNTTVAFTLGETAAATNGTSTGGVPNQVLFKLNTVVASTQSPLSVYSRAAHVFSVSPTAAQILGANGAAANPMYSFASSVNTGIYASGNAIAFSANGTFTAQLNASQLAMVAGSASAPCLSSTSAGNEGIFFPGSSLVGLSVSGIENSRFIVGGLQFSKGTGDAVAYAINFRKARGTVASPTVITTGDILSTESAFAYLGGTNTYRETARYEVASAGTISDATTGVGSVVTIYGKTQGTDATVQPTLVITGGSTATIKFAGTGMFTANGSTIATIGATCPGNAAVQEWLTVISSAGNTRYIPCF